jgi:hypothetical protein
MTRLAIASLLLAITACTGTNRNVLGSVDSSIDGTSPDGTSSRHWTQVPSGTSTNLYAVTGSSASDVVAVGGTPGAMMVSNTGVITRWNGSAWTATSNLVNLLAVSGSTAVGEYGDEGSETYWNGASWSSREILNAGYTRGVWEASPGTYAVGDGGALDYTSETGIPGSWGTIASGTTAALHAVWGTTGTCPQCSSVFVVGASGVILHSSDTGPGMNGTWTKATQGTSTLTGVWGSSASDIYAVGLAPATILHSHDGGSTWATITPPSDAVGLLGVGGNSATDVYVVGSRSTSGVGVIYHSAGDDMWTEESIPPTPDLQAVWVAPTGEVFVVGLGGTILQRGP